MTRLSVDTDLDRLDFSKAGGLVTVVAQDFRTGAVLMVAHADREALTRTMATGEMHYRSRTRGLWHKGETSGNVQWVVALHADCDGDAVVATVAPAGPACHTGAVGCFGTASEGATQNAADALDRLDATIHARAVAAQSDKPSYTRKLLADRNLRLKKLGEEAAELVMACADENRERALSEAADLTYHMLVALRALGLGIGDLRAALDARA
ncbi:MAG: phosphoribosyl-ATP diphosphatase [Gemmatimonadetes bacterium]|nr:phosphoribosyl-ATP diphosphatase [Gemmatimonadota bacterium]